MNEHVVRRFKYRHVLSHHNNLGKIVGFSSPLPCVLFTKISFRLENFWNPPLLV